MQIHLCEMRGWFNLSFSFSCWYSIMTLSNVHSPNKNWPSITPNTKFYYYFKQPTWSWLKFFENFTFKKTHTLILYKIHELLLFVLISFEMEPHNIKYGIEFHSRLVNISKHHLKEAGWDIKNHVLKKIKKIIFLIS